MFNTVLIANRGVIAARIIRTLKRLNIRSIAVYHDDDAQANYLSEADVAVSLGSGTVTDTYLNQALILNIAVAQEAEAIHPGYGFLSENTDFARACEAQDIRFVGPTPEQITAFGLKHEARKIAEAAGTRCIPGSPLLTNLQAATEAAADIGYPVMLKSTAGGGGIGMQVCQNAEELNSAWTSVRDLSGKFFANNDVFVEKFIARARHIEVQAFGDGQGNVVTLGERDCSVQRRNQKIIEETPAPNLTDATRSKLCRSAESLLASVNYRNAGTVEFIYDANDESFYFLEVNTRLQVEHGVTEEVWGVDLVECMLRQAAGEMPELGDWQATLSPQGHSIQVRTYAEDPNNDFTPSPGLVSECVWPQAPHIRLETWLSKGCRVPSLFDPMVAKIISHGIDRDECLEHLQTYLANTLIYGVETNLPYVSSILSTTLFQSGRFLTRSLTDHIYRAQTLEVLDPGTQTTIQDLGRPGYWHVGVPPSGPIDNQSFRIANALLDNHENAAALEIIVSGPTIRFNVNTRLAMVGAEIEAQLDDASVPMHQAIEVQAGQTLSLGKIVGWGARAYLAFAGGLDCPDYLGSKSTFVLGQFGGHGGRALQRGDTLRLANHGSGSSPHTQDALAHHQSELAQAEQDGQWSLRVVYGPHGAPEFFTPGDIEAFFNADWEVHYNSSRTGIRLIGPTPNWARDSGGEAGLHPSNIHDTAYAFGTVDFTGDMPVILGPDGPSLGGFVCPATVVHADLWKLGQLKAGHRVRFEAISIADAVTLEANHQFSVSPHRVSSEADASNLPSPIVLRTLLDHEEVVVRTAGDHFVLVEVGRLELDIARRMRVHRLMNWLQSKDISGLREFTPGVRSLQIHYDSQILSLDHLLKWIQGACEACTGLSDQTIPSRVVHLPVSWNDSACRQAVAHYMQSVRADAPWCPDNLEFIRRINGLANIDEVKQIIFDATYLVLGLGDVYLGAPLATPLNPAHRLVTTKYNPARTWTAENSVGIGGAYLCVYGMEGPGGYQLFGRTVQMWNRYRETDAFTQPWLLRFFDQIRFYEVSEEELIDIRDRFERGEYALEIETTSFDLSEYEATLDSQRPAIQAFSERRLAAFDAEMQAWQASGANVTMADTTPPPAITEPVPEGVMEVDAVVSGSVWELSVTVGQPVSVGQTLCIVESMKMEVPITAPIEGRVTRLLVEAGQSITTGQSLVWIEES